MPSCKPVEAVILPPPLRQFRLPGCSDILSQPLGYRWQSHLRDPISFHTHNLTQSPPLPQIDLLGRRNALMYFTAEAQTQTLICLHSSLRQDGFLLLGQVEHLVTRAQTSLFTPVNQQARVFTKVLSD